jgi:Peroxisomal biogenesis factor 11 (PEX11)
MIKSHLDFLRILHKILLLNDGRDKILKVIQYFTKSLLWIKKSQNKSLAQLVYHLSMARKAIRLLHFLDPFLEFIENISTSTQRTSLQDQLKPLGSALGIVNDISDDIICFGKMGVIDKQWVTRCTPISDRLWFLSIFIDIHSAVLSVLKIKKAASVPEKAQDPALKQKLLLARISVIKLFGDLLFCWIDVFKLDVSDGFQSIAGLLTGTLGTFKLIKKFQ